MEAVQQLGNDFLSNEDFGKFAKYVASGGRLQLDGCEFALGKGFSRMLKIADDTGIDIAAHTGRIAGYPFFRPTWFLKQSGYLPGVGNTNIVAHPKFKFDIE